MTRKRPKRTIFRKAGSLDQKHCEYSAAVYERLRQRKKKKFSHFLSFLKGPLRVKDGARFLDAACGTGELGSFLQKRGWRVTWFDFDYTLTHIAKCKNPSAQIFVGDLKAIPLKSECRFDIVLLRHVVEHIPDARKTIERLWGFVSEGGYMIVETPNAFNILAGDTRNYGLSMVGIKNASYISKVYSLRGLVRLCEGLQAHTCRMILPQHLPTWLTAVFLRLRVTHKIALRKQ